jgi:putative nucleotidyltransferase with HDIG domain
VSENVGYFEVSPSILLEGEKCNFDLFLSYEGKLFLFIMKLTPIFSGHLKKIKSENILHLLVKNVDADKYREYIFKNLSKIPQDDNGEREKKVKVVYDSAHAVMENLFRHPETTEAVKAVKEISDTVLKMLLEDEKSFASLVKISSKGYTTYTHSINVMVYSLALGMSIGLSGKDLETLGYGAALHDIGKSKVPIKLLEKTEKLTPMELEIIKLHPTKGLGILETLGEEDVRIRDAVYYHHEKLDGSGYPRGLIGDLVPLFARIVAIADIFDSLNSEKSYRPAMSSFETLQYMKTTMSKHLDIRLLKSFILCMSGR